MKKLLPALLISATLLSTAAPHAIAGGQAPSLSDIAGHWAEPEIQVAVKAGWVNGYPDGTFRPEGLVTRAEFLKMVTALRGGGPVEISDQRLAAFYPLSSEPEHWAVQSGAVKGALAGGLIDPADYQLSYTSTGGVTNWVPGLDHPLTRREAAMVLVRALGRKYEAEASYLYPDVAAPRLTFADGASIAPWLKGWVFEAASSGIVRGYPDGGFYPELRIKRSEAVVMLSRLNTASAAQTSLLSQLRPAQADSTEDLLRRDPRRLYLYGDIVLPNGPSVVAMASAWNRLPRAEQERITREHALALWQEVQRRDLGDLMPTVWVSIRTQGPNSSPVAHGSYDGTTFKYEGPTFTPNPLLVDPALEESLASSLTLSTATLNEQIASHKEFIARELPAYRELISGVERTAVYSFPYQYLGDWFTLSPAAVTSWVETKARAYWQEMKPEVEALGGTLGTVRVQVAPADTAGRAGAYEGLDIGATLAKNPVIDVTFDGSAVTVTRRPTSLKSWADSVEPRYVMMPCGEGLSCPDVRPAAPVARKVIETFVYTLGGKTGN